MDLFAIRGTVESLLRGFPCFVWYEFPPFTLLTSTHRRRKNAGVSREERGGPCSSSYPGTCPRFPGVIFFLDGGSARVALFYCAILGLIVGL